MIDRSSEDSIDPELRILGRSHWSHLLVREHPHPYDEKRAEDERNNLACGLTFTRLTDGAEVTCILPKGHEPVAHVFA